MWERSYEVKSKLKPIQSSSNSRPDSGHNRLSSRTEYLGETVKQLTMRAQTIHRSQSRASVGSSDSDSNSLNRTQIPVNVVPKEIDMYGKYLSGTIDEEQIESLSEGETDDRYVTV